MINNNLYKEYVCRGCGFKRNIDAWEQIEGCFSTTKNKDERSEVEVLACPECGTMRLIGWEYDI